MLRRLYFLFPDEPHAQRAVDDLISLDIPERRINAIAKNVELKTLPQATHRQRSDTAFRVEWFLWTANLVVFMLALTALVIVLIEAAFIWAVIPFTIMIATFVAGEYFVVHIPNVHLNEFTNALAHGEILLMVDVPKDSVAQIEHFIHHKYPVAVIGGVSWSVDAFGL